SKKLVQTPQKSSRLVEATSTDEIDAPTFNILTQISPPKKNEIPTKGGSSQSKKQVTQMGKNSQAKKIESPANQKGQKRRGEMVETPSDLDSNFVREKKKKKQKKNNKCRYGSVFKTIKRRATT
ncbi:hypothetical protein H5410_005285, partial [Solanum commersonii]